MNKAVLVAAAILVAPLTASGQEVRGGKDRDTPSMQMPPAQKGTEPASPAATQLSPSQKGSEPAHTEEAANEPLQSAFKARLAEEIEAVESACAGDIEDFCGTVPAGKGRLAMCMLAHEDMLSARCRFGLYRAERRLKRDVRQAAETCLDEIRSLCGETGGVRQCIQQKKGSLSSSCKTIVEAVGQRVRSLAGLVGADVYSSDDKNLGKVVQVTRGPDDRIESIQVDIGRVLGIGSKVVTISADKLQGSPRIKLQLPETEARTLPEAKKP